MMLMGWGSYKASYSPLGCVKQQTWDENGDQTEKLQPSLHTTVKHNTPKEVASLPKWLLTLARELSESLAKESLALAKALLAAGCQKFVFVLSKCCKKSFQHFVI